MDAPNLPTVAIPPGAPWWAYLLATLAPVAGLGLWVLHKHMERTAKPAEVTCSDCVAARTDIAAMRAEVGAALAKAHSGQRQIADLQVADSKVLEGVAGQLAEHGKALAAIDKTVAIIDRDSFRREPTR